MSREDDSINNAVGKYMAIGVGVGSAVGVAVGVAFNVLAFSLSIGIAIGSGIGIAVGSFMAKSKALGGTRDASTRFK